MTKQVTNRTYRIGFPAPFSIQPIHVFLVDESPRTLTGSGIKTDASFEALNFVDKRKKVL
jgi:hypothetical protein